MTFNSQCVRGSVFVLMCCGILIPVGMSATASAAEDVGFARDIQPLLAKRCFACHGPSQSEAGVAFHVRESALVKSEHGRRAIVPGNPDASELLSRIASADDSVRMPPEGPPLSKQEVELFRQWIQDGAVYQKHWSFVAPVRTEPPQLSHADKVRSKIDSFVLARLEKVSLSLSGEASREKLLRRLYVDLIGLLPSPQELDEFLVDDSDQAYERVVDRLLASEHFGERWGRHWLDLARYADSFGYERDDVRPNAWRYRDWVIQSLNRNQPFDRFVIDQLSGDLLDNPTRDQLIATGLHRMNIKNNESGINKEDYRNRETVDRVNTTSTSLLGLTVGCAQCHSHKYDAISQTEYYQLYSFFNNVHEADVDIEGTPEERSRYEQAKAAYETRKKRFESRKSLIEAMRKHNSARDWLKTVADKSPLEQLNVLDISGELKAAILDSANSSVELDLSIVSNFWATLAAQADDNRKAMRQLSVENRHLPKPYIMTLSETLKDRRATHVLVRGEFKQQGEEVSATTPAVLNSFASRQETGDRLDLARWIVSGDNPLTARVAVNHLWKHLFGRGLVATPDDFGTQGDPPSHPQLLDWLAVEFMESGWDRKQLIKTIVLSATYRQDSVVLRKSSGAADAAAIDPENRLLSRQSRFRVEAEVMRDLFLDASGLLHRKIGGPTIHPQLPSAVSDLGYKYKTRWLTSSKPDRYRRGLYVHFKRTNPYPSLIMFDGPESNVCLAMRNRSNTPLQALTTLNDPVFVECAQALGRRLSELPQDDQSRVLHAGRVCLTRRFQTREAQELARLLESERKWYAGHSAEAAGLVGEYSSEKVSQNETAAWIAVARTILNLDEFVTRE
jgi:hypothetical protein